MLTSHQAPDIGDILCFVRPDDICEPMIGRQSGRFCLAGRLAAGRMFLIGIMVLTIAVQGYFTQTHIHPQNLAGSSIAQKLNDSSPRHHNVPVDDSPANCPLCQQFLHNGQFVAPAALVFFLPTLAISTIEIAMLAARRFDAVSHSWLSRAPPRN